MSHPDFVSKAIDGLLASGAAERVHTTPWVVNPLGVKFRRGSTKPRLIIDMRYVNSFLQRKKFKYETVSDLSELLLRNDYLWSVDVASAYHHVELRPEETTYFGFQWQGATYEFKSLPFGLSVACWGFTKIMRELVGTWRGQGIRVLPYLDDFLYAGQKDSVGSFATLQSQQAIVLADFEKAGFVMQPEKCNLKFAQKLEHLGTEINTATGKFGATVKRWKNLQDTVRDLKWKKKVGVRALASFAGQAGSLHQAIGSVARIFTRATLRHIAGAPSWNSHVFITSEVLAELTFWANTKRLQYQTNIWRPARVEALTMYTDASDSGWGGWVRGTPVRARGYFAPWERVQSSTWRELQGVLQMLRSLPNELKGKEVILYTDNQGVESIIKKGASNSEPCHDVLIDIFWVCFSMGISLTCHWIPRSLNGN